MSPTTRILVSSMFAGLAALAVAACGSDSTAGVADARTELDACGLPEPCQGWVVWQPAGVPLVECVVDELAAGEPLHLTLANVPDGGKLCGTFFDIYAGDEGGALLVTTRDTDCNDVGEIHEQTVQHCLVRDDVQLQACQEALATWTASEGDYVPPCSSKEDWLVDCTPSEAFCI